MKIRIISIIIAAAICSAALTSCVGKREPGVDSGTHVPSDSVGINEPLETIYGDTLDEPGKVTVSETELHDYTEGNSSFCIWGSTVFYTVLGEEKIRYQDVNDVKSMGTPLYGDALAGYDGNPFSKMEIGYILVDARATAENDGVPVLIIAGDYATGYSEADGIVYTGTTIGSFNMLTNKWTVLKSGINGDIFRLAMYRDTIYFVTYIFGDEGYVIQKMDRDGGGYAKMENSDAYINGFKYIADDLIYYIDEKTMTLYTCDLDFCSRTPLLEGVTDVDRVADGYIYYSVETPEYFTDLYRLRLDGQSDPELLLDNATGSFIGDTFYYKKSANGGDGSNLNIYYAYDPDTGEDRVFFDMSGKWDQFSKFVNTGTDTYVICDVWYRGDTSDKRHMTCIDLVSGHEWKIPI